MGNNCITHMSTWRIDVIGDLVHLVFTSSNEGDAVAVLREWSSIWFKYNESRKSSPPNKYFTHAVDPFQIHFLDLRGGIYDGLQIRFCNRNWDGLPATTIMRFATCEVISALGNKLEEPLVSWSNIPCYKYRWYRLLKMDLSHSY